MLLFYIRHGDPTYNTDCLTPLGKRQAEAVAKRLSVHGVDKIFSSTSTRAYETAVPLSELTKKEITKLDFLNESNAWKYFSAPDKNGQCKWVYEQHEVKKIFVKEEVCKLGSKWYDFPEFAQYKFKEGIEFFNKNIDEFMLSLGYEHNRTNHTYKALRENNERIAIYAHAGIGRNFLSTILDIPYPSIAPHFIMGHTGMTVIEFDSFGNDIIPKVFQFSNDSHLYKEGMATNHCNITPI